MGRATLGGSRIRLRLSCPRNLLTQRRIQHHYQGKAGHQTERSRGLVTIAMGFRNDFMRDDEEHRPGCQPQPGRVSQGQPARQAHAEQRAQGFPHFAVTALGYSDYRLIEMPSWTRDV